MDGYFALCNTESKIHLSVTAVEAQPAVCPAEALCCAVKHLLKSAVREIRMLRSVGAGSGHPLPAPTARSMRASRTLGGAPHQVHYEALGIIWR